MTPSGEVMVLDAAKGPELPIVDGAGTARAIVWPGIGARLRSMHRIKLDPGSRTVELSHPSDAVYYVIAGEGTVAEGGADGAQELRAGSMIHVDGGTAYTIHAGAGGLDLIGGPAPADDALYASLREGS